MELTQLLLPGDSISELENLRDAWQTDYPGQSQTLITLREQLLAADWLRIRSQRNLHRFHFALAETYLPASLWNIRELRRFCLLQKLHTQAAKAFLLALHAIRSVHTAKAETKPAQSAPKPKLPPHILDNYQTAEITVAHDGTVNTRLDFNAAYWCENKLWQASGRILRQFHFPGAVIPDAYAFVLTHQGRTYPPVENFILIYSPEEFERLIRLELETNAETLLDGERLGYIYNL